MIKNKEQRPNIPKIDILKIGTFNGNIPNNDWEFDGKSDPNSVGVYHSEDWHLICGYTLDELKERSISIVR